MITAHSTSSSLRQHLQRCVYGFASILALLIAALPVSVSAASNYSPFDVYRLDNPKTGDHLYTGDVVEVVQNSCTQPSGYHEEGFYSFYTQAQQTATILPLYRLYNPTTNKHFYTTSDAEKAAALSLGFNYEGVDAYAQTVQQTQNEIPVHRFYSASTGDYVYTNPYSGEYSTMSHNGYVDEGIVWFEPDNSTTFGDTTLVRMYGPATHDHFYGTETEWQNIGCSDPQYKNEGIVFSAYACNLYHIYCDQSDYLLDRYYNAKAGVHIYVTSGEAAMLGPDWTYEGFWWYDNPDSPTSNEPIYRLRNNATGAYLYTTSVDEKITR